MSRAGTLLSSFAGQSDNYDRLPQLATAYSTPVAVLFTHGARRYTRARSDHRDHPYCYGHRAAPLRRDWPRGKPRTAGRQRHWLQLFSIQNSVRSWLELLQGIPPSMLASAVLSNPNNPHQRQIPAMAGAARGPGFEVGSSRHKAPSEFERAFAGLARSASKAVVVTMADPFAHELRD